MMNSKETSEVVQARGQGGRREETETIFVRKTSRKKTKRKTEKEL
jgi:hypothetical protein